jgi:hypothetical protein
MTEPRRFGKYSKVIRELEGTIRTLCQQMERIVAEKDAEIEQLKMEKRMTDEQIKYMVDRFLGWKLPSNFNPDGGISFKTTFNDHLPQPMKNEPVGTNLLDAMQADAMVRHMVTRLPRSRNRPCH